MRAAMTSPASLQDLMDELVRDEPRATFALTTTAGDGRFRLALPVDPQNPDHAIDLVVTAHGHEIVNARASASGSTFVLRTATPIDIDARCGDSPCTGKLLVSCGSVRELGTHLERLGPTSCTITAHVDEPDEMRARFTAAVPSGAGPTRVALQRTGTGFSITGRVVRVGDTDSWSSLGTAVRARCGPDGDPLYRSAIAGAKGEFELRDVPAAPCFVWFSTHGYFLFNRDQHGAHEVRIDRLPATDVEIEVKEPPPCRSGMCWATPTR